MYPPEKPVSRLFEPKPHCCSGYGAGMRRGVLALAALVSTPAIGLAGQAPAVPWSKLPRMHLKGSSPAPCRIRSSSGGATLPTERSAISTCRSPRNTRRRRDRAMCNMAPTSSAPSVACLERLRKNLFGSRRERKSKPRWTPERAMHTKPPNISHERYTTRLPVDAGWFGDALCTSVSRARLG